MGGESAGPGDIAVAHWIEAVTTLAEDPFMAGVTFAQSKNVRGDVLMLPGEALSSTAELIHEGEAEVMFFGGKIYGFHGPGKFLAGFPADLTAEAGFVADALNARQFAEEEIEGDAEEIPVFGAAGEEGAEPEFVTLSFIDVNGGEIALAAGGDFEAEAIVAFGGE